MRFGTRKWVTRTERLIVRIADGSLYHAFYIYIPVIGL